ncbi:TetR/AcrR family transcriptional regulator [Novosphingobium sp.]|uniref:TetR/AcrR family transcriptional regulator n=1 Tax=Novosphingobium sp. TaxID=1874826 RepID=UPI0035B18BEF
MANSVKKARKGEATRLQILQVAERDFAELGYDATRLEAIGDSIGIKRAAIFYHFRSKRELFEDVFAGIHSSLVAHTEDRLAGASDPWERLLLLVESWVDFMVARPAAARLILRNCANAEHPDDYSPDFSQNALQMFRDIIADGAATGRFAPSASMHLVNLLSGSILHYVCNPQQLGDDRPYRPDDPAEVALFKSILRRTARAIVDPG